MAELSQIKIGGVLYDIKDTIARENSGIELDTEMNETSTNGVQNCVIKAYVDNAVATEIEVKIQDVVKDSVSDTLEDNAATDDDIDSMFQ